jgi:hypothetical protein
MGVEYCSELVASVVRLNIVTVVVDVEPELHYFI